MVSYSVEIGGTPVPYVSFRYNRSYKLEPQQFQLEMTNTGETYVLDHTVRILRDGDLVFEGKTKSIKKTSRNLIELCGFDLKFSAAKLKAVNRIESAVALGTQVANQISGTDLIVGDIDAGTVSSMEYGSDDNSKFTRLQVFREIAFVQGYELEVTSAGAVYFKPACGVDHSTDVVFKYGELLKDWVEPHTENIERKIEKATVIGKGQGDRMDYGSAQTGGYVAGDPEVTLSRKNLINSSTCTLAATAYLADAENTVEYGAISVVDTYSGKAYDIYDTIKIVDFTRGVNGNYRVMGINKEFGGSGEKTAIYYSNLTKITSNAEFLVEPGEGFINDLKNRGNEYAQTDQGPQRQTVIVGQSENLVPNSSFEMLNEEETLPEFYETATEAGSPTYGVDTTNTYKGVRSTKITSLTTDKGVLALKSNYWIPVAPARKYLFKLMVKGSVAYTDGNGVALVQLYQGDKTSYVEAFGITDKSVTTSFKEFQVTFTTAATDRYAKIKLYCYLPSADATAYFSDIILSEQRAAISTDGSVACANSGTTATTELSEDAWTDCNAITVPNTDHEEYFVHATIVGGEEITDDNDYVFARIKATKAGESTVYYPASDMTYCPMIVLPDSSHLYNGGSAFFTIPKNVKGWTLTLQCIIDYIVDRHFDVRTWVVGWGHSQHTHQ